MNHTFTVLEGDCDLDDDLPAQLDFTNLKPDWEQTEKRREIARSRVIHTENVPDNFWIISAREATNREEEIYARQDHDS